MPEKQPSQQERHKTMRQIVANYNAQVRMVGGSSSVTLGAYITGIQKGSGYMSDDDVAYAHQWAEQLRKAKKTKK